MKELFREKDATRIGFYQALLEAEGIRTHVRNRDLVTTMGTEVPIPEFFPALCVVDDADYDAAIECLRESAGDDHSAPTILPHETKGIVAVGVCAICVMLIVGTLFLTAHSWSELNSSDYPWAVGVAVLSVIAGLAGVWAVLKSYRATKLRQREAGGNV